VIILLASFDFCQLVIIKIRNYWVAIVTIEEFLVTHLKYSVNMFGVFCFDDQVDNNHDNHDMDT